MDVLIGLRGDTKAELGDFLVVARNFVGIGHREERGGKCPIPTNRTETGRIFSKYGHLMTA